VHAKFTVVLCCEEALFSRGTYKVGEQVGNQVIEGALRWLGVALKH
jgi:hypothetical protein